MSSGVIGFLFATTALFGSRQTLFVMTYNLVAVCAFGVYYCTIVLNTPAFLVEYADVRCASYFVNNIQGVVEQFIGLWGVFGVLAVIMLIFNHFGSSGSTKTKAH